MLAGIPRSGQHFLRKSIGGSISHMLAPPECFYPEGDTSRYKQTQGYYKNLKKGGYAIFVFGDPVLSVISTRNRFPEDANHAKNCGYYGDPKIVGDRIFYEDILNYERIFDSWVKWHEYRCLVIRYETVPKYWALIEEFCGHSIKRRRWAERKTTRNMVSKEELEAIEHTYSDLIWKAKWQPNFQVLGE